MTTTVTLLDDLLGIDSDAWYNANGTFRAASKNSALLRAHGRRQAVVYDSTPPSAADRIDRTTIAIIDVVGESLSLASQTDIGDGVSYSFISGYSPSLISPDVAFILHDLDGGFHTQLFVINGDGSITAGNRLADTSGDKVHSSSFPFSAVLTWLFGRNTNQRHSFDHSSPPAHTNVINEAATSYMRDFIMGQSYLPDIGCWIVLSMWDDSAPTPAVAEIALLGLDGSSKLVLKSSITTSGAFRSSTAGSPIDRFPEVKFRKHANGKVGMLTMARNSQAGSPSDDKINYSQISIDGSLNLTESALSSLDPSQVSIMANCCFLGDYQGLAVFGDGTNAWVYGFQIDPAAGTISDLSSALTLTTGTVWPGAARCERVVDGMALIIGSGGALDAWLVRVDPFTGPPSVGSWRVGSVSIGAHGATPDDDPLPGS